MSVGSATERTYLSNLTTGIAAAAARIEVTSGPDAGAEAIVPERGLLVGTAATCGLVLGDSQVSRTHAEIRPEGAGFRVRDLASTNGTFVDGLRVTDVVAHAGAVLRLGRTSLRIVGAERYVAPPPSERTSFGGLEGRSVAIRQVFGLLERVAGSDASVLIEGETGTGKEIVARALHTESPRRKGPFVVLDCSAISPSLAESELFGHTKGAFTGAVETRPGAFERAHGGVLFLDELGELPLELQAKLLRALESREILRVGGSEPIRVDVRIVAGTNRDLDAMVSAGTFRADLFYRLAIVRVILPPLRGRTEDLAPLVGKFLRELGVDDPGAIDGSGFAQLASYDWPGNVRELRNVIQRAVASAGSTRVRFAELPIQLGRRRREAPIAVDVPIDRPFLEARDELVGGFERRYLVALRDACGGNIAEVARRSKLNRRYLYVLLKKHDLV